MPDSNPIDDASQAVKCEIKSLFNHDPGSRHTQWSEFESAVDEEQRIQNLGKNYAVVHRLSKVEKDDGEYAWVTHSIEAQSPRLRKALDQIFCDYPSWYPDGKPYAVSPPFKPYLHRWNEISASLQHQNTTNKTELQLLRRELQKPLEPHLEALKKVKESGAISFALLWLILAPGCLMLSCENGNLCVSRLNAVELIPKHGETPAFWRMDLDQVDWDGVITGFKRSQARIYNYKEPTLVVKLGTYPLEFDPNVQQITKMALERGRIFESLRGFHVKTCNGNKYTLKLDPHRGCLREIEKPVSGRVIVDAYAYHRLQGDSANAPPSLDLLPVKVADKPLDPIDIVRDDVDSDVDSDASSETGIVVSENSSRNASDKRPEAQTTAKMERIENLRPMTDVECILAVPRVKGFDLQTKEWCELNVDNIRDAGWDDAPYKNLVLPPGEKDLVFAFADRARYSKGKFDDFVQQKGQGIIILLCGPPGVGKTLTAEAAAEMSKAPLYVLSAGDLGTNPANVDLALTGALERCRLWDALLLLDEADVFLETRDSNSLARNELVSIFLRRLEYYRGLMFLTTNRISAIDTAFKGRIDLILPYYDLDEDSRKNVWKNFINRLDPGLTEVSQDDFDVLAKNEMNGREIKNSIKTAMVLAEHKKEPLKLEHLRVVLDIRKRVSTFEQLHEERNVMKQQPLRASSLAGKRKHGDD